MALDILGKNPVQTSLALFMAALGFRLVDLFLLRLDERLMEEGLFRGVMLRHFMIGLPWWRANLLQAGLFAAWHLVWPFKRWITGSSNLAGILSEAVSLGSATLMSGYAYGYLYYSTGSLWAP